MERVCEMICEPLSNKGYELAHLRISTITKNNDRFSVVRREISELEEMYARDMTAFTIETIENIETNIASQIERIKSVISELPSDLQEIGSEWLGESVKNGNRKVKVCRELLQLRSMGQVASLNTLTPREFEEWTADLFQMLGYEVELTPYTNDGGVDVWAIKDGQRVAVQCKRYNGLVHSKELRDFHKATSTLEDATTLIFVTSGIYTPTAFQFAEEHGIVLYDRYNLGELVRKKILMV